MAKKKQAQRIRQAKGVKPRVFPVHLATTPAEWRAIKRQEWREVAAAYERYLYGAAYAPARNEVWKVGQLLRQITEQLKPSDWVAW